MGMLLRGLPRSEIQNLIKLQIIGYGLLLPSPPPPNNVLIYKQNVLPKNNLYINKVHAQHLISIFGTFEKCCVYKAKPWKYYLTRPRQALSCQGTKYCYNDISEAIQNWWLKGQETLEHGPNSKPRIASQGMPS